MEREYKQNRETLLREWRTKILNSFLIFVAIVSVPVFIITVLRVIGVQNFWSTVLPFAIVEILLLVVTFFRSLDYRARVIVLLIIGYVAAIVNLWFTGLGGVAPLYLLVVPIVALILMGKKAGIYATLLSALLILLFSFLYNQDLLEIIDIPQSFLGSTITILMLLAIGMVL